MRIAALSAIDHDGSKMYVLRFEFQAHCDLVDAAFHLAFQDEADQELFHLVLVDIQLLKTCQRPIVRSREKRT